MGIFPGQLRQVLRRLRLAPTFTAIAVITLALGIGANTAIFSILDGVLLKPLPYPDPDRLIGLWFTAPGINLKELNMCPSLYFTFREHNRTFRSVGIYTGDRVSVTGLGAPEQVRALDLTSEVLPMLGTHPTLGRVFSARDDLPGSPQTILLSHAYWQRHFGASQSVVGHILQVDGKPREVIGVLPSNFRFLDMEADLFIPFQFDRAKVTLGNYSYQGVARLAPGVTISQASSDVARMLPIENRSFPPPPGFSAKLFTDARIAPTLRPFKQDLTGDVGATLWALMATIGLVLLIACANVANLLLVRVESRHLELTIRTALGATTGRIAYELLLESLTVAALGGLTGLALAIGALRLIVAIAPAGLPRINEIGIDAPVLLFVLAVSLLTGLLFGAVPVLKFTGLGLATSLREGGRSISVSRERHRARQSLVVVQVALALILLISSGLMIRTFRALTQVEPGFSSPEHIQSLSLSITEPQVPDANKVLRMEEDIVDQLKAINGVQTVAMTTAIPMNNNSSNDVLYARGRNYREGQLPPLRRFIFASPNFAAAMGVSLLAGRDFTWTDNNNLRLVAMVSESLARDLWGSPAGALHQQIREGMNDGWREVVGVVADVHFDGVERPSPSAVYFPLRMENFENSKDFITRDVICVIRSSRAGSQNFLGEIRHAVWAVNPNLPLARVRTQDDLYRASMARTSFTLVLLIVAAAMALLLGAIGIYGVIAYTISQRTREIGIRMALGAGGNNVAGMFIREGMLLVAVGASVGMVGAFALTRLLSALLFGVKPGDPLTYAGMLAILLIVAFIASYLPSRRAIGMDPAIALRSD